MHDHRTAHQMARLVKLQMGSAMELANSMSAKTETEGTESCSLGSMVDESGFAASWDCNNRSPPSLM